MVQFQGEKCCRLASKNKVSASTRQFLIYSTLVFFVQIREQWDNNWMVWFSTFQQTEINNLVLIQYWRSGRRG